MIENALVFALGALSAGFLALVLLPLLTGRARRLAQAEAAARLPRSAGELAAAKDAVRAEFAARTARVDAELSIVRTLLVEEQAARMRDQQEGLAARSEATAMRRVLRDLEGRIEDLKLDLRQRDDSQARTAAELRDAENRLQIADQRQRDLQERIKETDRLVHDMRGALVRAEAEVGSLSGAAEQIKTERDAFARRAADAERRVALQPAAETDSTAALDHALQSLLQERQRLIEESLHLRNERDRARLEAADRSLLGPPHLTLVHSAPPAPPSAPPPVSEALSETTADGPGEATGAATAEEADPQVQRVEDLANRLKALRSRNAGARGRGGSAKEKAPKEKPAAPDKGAKDKKGKGRPTVTAKPAE